MISTQKIDLFLKNQLLSPTFFMPFDPTDSISERAKKYPYGHHHSGVRVIGQGSRLLLPEV